MPLPKCPPAANLKAFIAAGADLVAFSGGKHIQGPQATGILCGRGDLILSAALQHQDMDVFPETWPLRSLIENGTLVGPPHHGIGRGFKVGKEEIVGLMTALELYQHRDFRAELSRWTADLEYIVSSVLNMPGVVARIQFPQPNGREVPSAIIHIDAAVVAADAHAVINALQEGDPPICVFEKHAGSGEIVIFPEALRPGEAADHRPAPFAKSWKARNAFPARLMLQALPLESRAVHTKLNEAAVLDLCDITRAPVGPTEANVSRLRAQHVDLAQYLSLRRNLDYRPLPQRAAYRLPSTSQRMPSKP